jgi:hypothetical protein
MSLRVWRYPIAFAWHRVGAGPFRTPFIGRLGRDYFGWPLSYDEFETGASDYEMSSDEIYCPCGAVMCWDGDAGDLLRRIDDHCKSNPSHPMPVRSEAF